MFKLTRQEQRVVAFLVAALLLGTAVRWWRQSPEAPTAPPPQQGKGDR